MTMRIQLLIIVGLTLFGVPKASAQYESVHFTIDQAAKFARPLLRDNCGVDQYRQVASRYPLSIPFLDEDALANAEAALDDFVVSEYFQRQGLAIQLHRSKKSIEEDLSKYRGKRRYKDRVQAAEIAIKRVDDTLKPPTTTADFYSYFKLSSLWYADTIRRLRNANFVWSDYRALVEIDKFWLRSELAAHCTEDLPILFRQSPHLFEPINRNGVTLSLYDVVELHQAELKELRLEVQSALERIIVAYWSDALREIDQRETSDQITYFFVEYLQGSKASNNAMKNTGLYDVFDKRYNELMGSTQQSKYKN